METKDYEGAKELLAYWLQDAKEKENYRGLLSLSNESMGFFRKTGDKEHAVNCAETALRLIERLGDGRKHYRWRPHISIPLPFTRHSEWRKKGFLCLRRRRKSTKKI